MKTTLAIVDDHQLLVQALSELIARFDDYEVTLTANNGNDLLRVLQRSLPPDILLLDVHMPVMDGFETALKIGEAYPSIKILALSMLDREDNIIRMVRHGARGYLLKDCRSAELRQALDNIRTKGYHYSDFLTDRLIRNLNAPESAGSMLHPPLNARELAFISLACSDLTYAAIADRMCVSVRTVDGYREVLFQKMNVKSRVGLALMAVRWGLVNV